MLTNTLHYARRHRLTAMSLALFAAASLLSLLTAALAQTVTPPTITLRVGGPGKAIGAKNKGGQDVTPNFKSFSEDGIAVFDAASKSFKPIKAGETTAKLEFTENNQPVELPEVKITVLPKIESYLITYDETDFKSTDEIKIGQGVQWDGVEISAVDVDGEAVKNVTATVKTGSDKLEISSSSPYTLTAKNVGEATLTLKTPDDNGQTFKVKILEPIDASKLVINDVSVTENGTKTFTPVILTTGNKPVGIGDKEYGVRIDLDPNPFVELRDAKTLSARTLDAGQNRTVTARLHLPAVSFAAGAAPRQLIHPFRVTVEATGAYMYFVPATQPLFPGGSVRIDAYFRDRNGAPVQNYRVMKWSVDDAYKDYVAVASEGNSVTVIRKDGPNDERVEEPESETERRTREGGRRSTTTRAQSQAARRAATKAAQARRAKLPRLIPIKAEAHSVGGSEVLREEAYVQLREITKFQPLSVKLNVMDDTTAKDLYGGVAASEYYILMVRLFNDLRDDETKKYTGASIIVYSGSVEVAVNLEKQYDEKSKSAKKKSGGASPAPSPTEGYVADGRWYEVDPGADIYDVIADTDFKHKPPTSEETEIRFGDDPVCEDTITYRPLMFEMVVNTVDRREGRSLRSKIFDGLELVGIGASFSSAIRFPRPGRDLPIITDRFTNLLVPGMEKIFPSLKEQHRQNIVSQVMKPIEEVPFGSDLTRVLFIPKRAMRGVIPNHKVRISQICPYYFKIKVAVVDKTGQTTVEQGTRR